VLVALLTALIVAFSYWWGMATYGDIERMSAHVTMDVFVQDDAADSILSSHRAQLSSLPGVRRVQFDNGDKVWSAHLERMRIGGEDLEEIVQIPHRFRLTMRPAGATTSRMIETESLVTSIVGSELVRVAWSPDHVEYLSNRRAELRLTLIVAIVLFVLQLVVSIVYSFRAEVHHAATDLSVGAVLGAAPSITAFPHFLICTLAAISGCVVAAAILLVVRPMVVERVPWMSAVELSELLCAVSAVMLALIVVGWLLTYAAAHKSARHGKADHAT